MMDICTICLPAGKTSKDDEAWAAMGLLYLGCLDEAHEAMMIIRQTAHRNKLITALYFLNQVWSSVFNGLIVTPPLLQTAMSCLEPEDI